MPRRTRGPPCSSQWLLSVVKASHLATSNSKDGWSLRTKPTATWRASEYAGECRRGHWCSAITGSSPFPSAQLCFMFESQTTPHPTACQWDKRLSPGSGMWQTHHFHACPSSLPHELPFLDSFFPPSSKSEGLNALEGDVTR